MGFYIKPRTLRDGRSTFSVFLENNRKDAPKRYSPVPKHTWLSKGIDPSWTAKQAQEWARSENARLKVDRIREAQVRTEERLAAKRLAELAFLPSREVEEFERTRILKRSARASHHKRKILWESVRTCLTTLQIDPENHADEATRFYDYFVDKAYSPSTVQKMLRWINDWGQFYCKRRKVFYEPVPAPRGTDRRDIEDAARQKKVKRGNRVSAALTFEHLESRKSKLKPEHYNWLYVALAFGCRPTDMDALHGEFPYKTWEQDGVQVVDIYQPKVREYKSVPCFRPEQRRALTLLKSAKLRKPGYATLKRHLGPEYSLYCARNNFIPWMLQKKYPIERISKWMGHKTIERTWEYFNKLKDRRLITQAG